MSTRNVNLKTAAQESSRKMGEKLHELSIVDTKTRPCRRKLMRITGINSPVLMHTCISSVAY